MNVLIVGRGRVGNALKRALTSDGRHEVATAGRRVAKSRVRTAEVVVLAVPDHEIEAVARAIAPSLTAGATVLHCAGAREVEELEACRAHGAHTGVMHPLVSFPSKRSHASLRGTTFTLRGSRGALAAGRRIASACGARAVVAESGGPAYHAAAALVANGAAALSFVAVGVLTHIGFERHAAERAIGGLLRSVGDNVEHLGVPHALTGPVVRGEVKTVQGHRAALRQVGKEALRAYDAVLPVIVTCARAAGLSSHRAEKIRHLTRR